MKILVIGDKARFEKFLPDSSVVKRTDVAIAERGTADDDIAKLAGDADVIVADAISPVGPALMDAFPGLKLVHSEGVAYNAVDVAAARERGIAVCNCAGMNAASVAEQTVLLMLACLRRLREGDRAVREGRQIEVKERLMVEGLRDLCDCTVGLVGLGAIAVETARRLNAFGCDIAYWNRRRRTTDVEERLGVRYLPLDELARACDIVSIHVPVTPETENLVDAAFLAAMKPDAVLVNTARGEIVDQAALAAALETRAIGAAGLDTLSPEPVAVDHPLVRLSPAAADRLVLSPHIGGVTEGAFRRGWSIIWGNIARLDRNEPLVNIVS